VVLKKVQMKPSSREHEPTKKMIWLIKRKEVPDSCGEVVKKKVPWSTECWDKEEMRLQGKGVKHLTGGGTVRPKLY